MRLSISGESFELDSSAKTIDLAVAALGITLIFVAEYIGDQSLRFSLMNLMLLLLSAAIIDFAVDVFYPRLSRWLLVIALSAILFYADLWLGFPGMLGLVVLPVLLGMILLGFLPAVLSAGVLAGVMIGLGFAFPSLYPVTKLFPPLFTLAFFVIILYRFNRQVVGLSVWSVAYWKKGYLALREASQKSEDLEKALGNLTTANQLLLQANMRADRMREYAENAEKTKALFVARVSHEFRTPLNMIIGLVEIMVESPETYAFPIPPDLSDDLSVVLRNCQHLSGMIDDVLDLTRVEAGSVTLRREEVALSEIFQEAAEAVAPLIHNKGLRMTIDASDQLPAVYCDRLRIRQVILNLVSNAARFTEHGSIDIKATSSKNQVLVSVTDTGPGISTEDIERIFEPFCQGTLQDQGRDKGGSGLGLTISKQFVELHGGQMWLTSQLGEGTTFFFTLPIRPLPDAPRRAGGWIQPDWIWRESTFVSAGLESPDRTPKPCIAVFDETGGLNRELEKFQDVLVVQALDLAKSDLLSPDTIDVVWVNVPPGQHSQDVQQAVESRFPGVPIVTSNFLDGGWPEVNDHVQFLTKPVSMEKLSAAIDRAGGEVARVLVVDDDADVRSLLKRLLHIYDSYLEVAVAENGQDAVHMAVAHPYDLILLDIVMLSMSGWEVLRVLRENEATRDVPVIILSAQDLADRSPVSHTYAVNSEEGFTCKRLLECTAVLANLLMERGPTRVPAPEENRGA